MTLQSLVAFLLPADYREQVLGDLQERGFRPRDIASVLPRVWWSYFRRGCNVPNLAGASESFLRQRVEQFRRRSLGVNLALSIVWGATKVYAVFQSSSNIFFNLFIIGGLAVGCIGALLGSCWRLIPTERETMLKQHRSLLALSRRHTPMLSFIAGREVLGILLVSASRTQRVTVTVTLLILFVPLFWARDRRLRKELDALQ